MNNIKKIYNVLNNKFEIIINFKLLNKKKMDDIKQIVKLQNIDLLKRIGDDKFITDKDKQSFIDKYNKTNYRNFKVKSDTNILDGYIKISNCVLKNK
tara:strand:+ start:3283 stop:3573 length:291 start_codon:yes stop_codon:yes gene_type:complete